MKVWHFLHASSGIIGKHRHRSGRFIDAEQLDSSSMRMSHRSERFAKNRVAGQAGREESTWKPGHAEG
jgi:hypothetical protein